MAPPLVSIRIQTNNGTRAPLVMKYARPEQLDEALGLLATGRWAILAGGTDYYPALRDKPPQGDVLDLCRLGELKQLSNDGEFLRIGALVTWTDLVKAALPVALDGLKLSAREILSLIHI